MFIGRTPSAASFTNSLNTDNATAAMLAFPHACCQWQRGSTSMQWRTECHFDRATFGLATSERASLQICLRAICGNGPDSRLVV
jgi:hypothetical protein